MSEILSYIDNVFTPAVFEIAGAALILLAAVIFFVARVKRKGCSKHSAKTAALAIMCALSLPLVWKVCNGPAQAATIMMSDGNLFDPSFYSRQNGSRTGINNMDANILYNHYLTVGRHQGKLPYNPSDPAMEDVGSIGCEQDDAAVTASLWALRASFPDGTPCTNAGYKYDNCPIWPWTGGGCVAFAQQISDLVYGNTAKVVTSYALTENDLRPGDVLKYYRPNGVAHCVVVISVSDSSITVCEGNRNAAISWGRAIQKSTLTGRVIYVARREAAE